jgi:hypothetical protein
LYPHAHAHHLIGLSHWLWPLLLLPLFSGIGYSAVIQFSGVMSLMALSPPASPGPRYLDSAREHVWLAGQETLSHLASGPILQPASSFVERSAGNILSLCGTVENREPNGQNAEQHVVSLWGVAQETVFETTSVTFPVLWQRLCEAAPSAW